MSLTKGIKQLNFRICTFLLLNQNSSLLIQNPIVLLHCMQLLGCYFLDLINTMLTLQLQTIIFYLYTVNVFLL